MTIKYQKRNPFRRVQYISPINEIISVAFRQVGNLPPISSKRLSRVEKIARMEQKRISTLAEILTDKIEIIIHQFPWIEDIHPFYREICDLIGNTDEIRRILGRLDGIKKQIFELEKEQLMKLRDTDHPPTMAQIRVEASGRMSSITKKAKGDVNYLIRVIKKLKAVPDFDITYPTIVVAGAPNVGKSSLVNEISSGSPEIAEYPFTTKHIVFGHRDLGFSNIQIVDTPGLLDRPFKERNLIEMQSITSMKYISDLIVFMFDSSKDAAITSEEQLSLYEDIKNEFPDVPIIRVLNKVDLLSEEEVKNFNETFDIQYNISLMDIDSLQPLISKLEKEIKSLFKSKEKFKELLKLNISAEFLPPKEEEEINYDF